MCYLLSCWHLAWFIGPWIWRWYVHTKRWLTLRELHGFISQKAVPFITTDVRTSYETLVDFKRTTRLYIPEGSALYNHRCKNLWSYTESRYLLKRFTANVEMILIRFRTVVFLMVRRMSTASSSCLMRVGRRDVVEWKEGGGGCI
jgi:hypothetical protein